MPLFAERVVVSWVVIESVDLFCDVTREIVANPLYLLFLGDAGTSESLRKQVILHID